MKVMKTLTYLGIVISCLLSAIGLSAHAQGTAFSYQGRLNDGGSPATGIYDVRFTVCDALTSGSVVAGPITNAATGVTNGLFAMTLDFSNGVFTGPARWLEIAARTNGAASFITLSPRQPVLPTPYAVMANSASNLLGNVPSVQLSGTVALTQLPTAVVTNNASGLILNGTFNGNAGGLTNVNAATLTGTAANLSVGSLTVSSNLYLPATTATNGIIYSGGNTLIQTYGTKNFFAGTSAGNLTMTGTNNVGVGLDALQSNTTGYRNTANGNYALQQNTTGFANTANGYGALMFNTNGNFNTANGCSALVYNTTGSNNTANGNAALYFNTTGYNNTANGNAALFFNTTGYDNTANGTGALNFNTAGACNTANGYEALQNNTTGSYNTANGRSALQNNTTGNQNTANGNVALLNNTNGSYNTANGDNALVNITSGSNNIADGYQAGYNLTTGSSNIDIGNMGVATDTNIIRIGSGQKQAFIAGQIIGDGSGLTNLNVGQLPGAVLTNNANSVTLSGTFKGNGASLTNIPLTGLQLMPLTNSQGGVTFTGLTTVSNLSVTATNFVSNLVVSNPPALDGSGIINLNASQLTSGTVSLAQLPGVVVTNNATGITMTGTFNGTGTGLTNVPAAAITGGLTTNFAVLVPGGGTNTLCFTNGILVSIQ